MTRADRWDEPQRNLIERVLWAHTHTGEWPVYQWIEAELWKRGERALDVIESLPKLGGPWARGRTYGDLRVQYGGVPRPEDRVSLTVRALIAFPTGRELADIFVRALDLAAEIRNIAVYDPVNVVSVRMTNADVDTRLQGLGHPAFLKELYELFRLEPVDGFHSSGSGQDGSWWYDLGPEVVRYAGLTPDSYVEMVEADLTGPAELPRPRVLANPLDISTALTYLDTTWRLHCERSLLKVEDLAAVTSLAYPVGSGDEFTARCSALGDQLKSLQAPSAPGVAGHALQRLKAYLETNLAEDDRQELDEAMDTLDLVRRARNARSHAAAAADGFNAMEALGVPGPPFDWAAVWERIQSATANALMDLRMVVARLPAR
ncbi:MAG: hypothetical protein M3N95_02210 [Actinomycetota bacterium]|nr:hypothetical protein [Actinomycetota bacterium]